MPCPAPAYRQRPRAPALPTPATTAPPDERAEPTTGPVQPRQRIQTIDILCGFAIFGILLVNMEFYQLYDRIGIAAGIVLTLAIYAVQIGWSIWWLSRFRFGPMEWLWRTLTYCRRQPMAVDIG